MRFSIIIPARNEEAYLPACLESIRHAARPYPGEVEVIVCLNRCTDRTEEIAHAFGTRIVREDAKNLALIRNAGAAAATGEILLTIDADSTMTRNLLMEVDAALADDGVVGGGVHIMPERISLGIVVTGLLLLPYMLFWLRISAGCFWCRRETFEAINGFDASLLSAEDIDFACRLKAHGRRHGQRFATLWRGYIRTSCRKFDQFGDWFALRKLPMMLSLLRGRNRGAADLIWYDVRR